jgi:hypothetical protein
MSLDFISRARSGLLVCKKQRISTNAGYYKRRRESVVVQFEFFTGMVIAFGLWETIVMSKPTKKDKTRRRSTRVRRKIDKVLFRNINDRTKNTPDEDFGQAAARIVREATKD